MKTFLAILVLVSSCRATKPKTSENKSLFSNSMNYNSCGTLIKEQNNGKFTLVPFKEEKTPYLCHNLVWVHFNHDMAHKTKEECFYITRLKKIKNDKTHKWEYDLSSFSADKKKQLRSINETYTQYFMLKDSLQKSENQNEKENLEKKIKKLWDTEVEPIEKILRKNSTPLTPNYVSYESFIKNFTRTGVAQLLYAYTSGDVKFDETSSIKHLAPTETNKMTMASTAALASESMLLACQAHPIFKYACFALNYLVYGESKNLLKRAFYNYSYIHQQQYVNDTNRMGQDTYNNEYFKTVIDIQEGNRLAFEDTLFKSLLSALIKTNNESKIKNKKLCPSNF